MPKIMTQIHPSIPRTHLKFIGEVVFYWATVEHVLVDIIGTALKLGPKERRILLTRMDAKAKITLLKVVGSKFTKNRNARQNINALAAQCRPLYDFRNICAHSVWIHPIDNPDLYQVLVIDSGEAAYLPARMSLSLETMNSRVSQFKDAARHARLVLSEVIAVTGRNQTKDGDSGGTGVTVSDP